MIIEKTKEEPQTLAERVRMLEKNTKMAQREVETLENTREFKFPWKFKRKFAQTNRKRNADMILVEFLNKKNEIEPPKFMPIYEGNMIIYKHKPYEFDPRAVWTRKGIRGNPKTYLIKEIDRRPVRNKYGKGIYVDAAVSNMDLDEIRERGDSTESDEFLIKAALRARIEQARRKINWIVLGIVGIVLVVGLIWFLRS